MLNCEIIEKLTTPASIINSEGGLVFQNEAFSALVETRNQNEITLDDEHEFYNEYRKRIAISYGKALEGQEAKCFVVLKTGSGNKLPVELYLYPMKMEDDSGILVLFKKVEDRLASFDKKVEAVESDKTAFYDFSPYPVIQFDKTSCIIKASCASEHFFGMGVNKLIQNPEHFFDAFSSYNAGKIKTAIDDIVNSRKSFIRINDVSFTSQSSKTTHCNLLLYPLATTDVEKVELIIEDRTRIKLLEQKLSKMNRVQVFSDMTKGLLHSFNNIINIISNRAQMLMQLTEKDNILDGLGSIRESAMDAATQIRRIQEFITPDSTEVEESSTDIIELIRDAIEFASIHFKVENKERGRNITISKQYFVKTVVSGNIKLLREIIVSMIFRISSYISEKGQVEIELKQDEDLIFTVSVNKEFLESDMKEPTEVFIPEIELRRLADTISVRLFEEESADQISLKAIIPAKMIVDKPEQSSSVSKQKVRDCDILIVEDEPALSEILYELFDFMGNRVTLYDNAESALNEFKAHTFDIVISDYGLSGMTGIEFLTKIREISESTVTVLLTGWVLEEIQLYKKSVDLFMQKPFQIDVLLQQISHILSEKA